MRPPKFGLRPRTCVLSKLLLWTGRTKLRLLILRNERPHEPSSYDSLHPVFEFLIADTLSVGLGLDCSNWVRSGHISTLDEQDRVATFWTTYCLDKCWAFYVARDLGVPNPLYTSSASQAPVLKCEPEASVESFHSGGSNKPPGMSIRLPDVDTTADEQVWEWRAPTSGRTGSLIGKSSQAMPCNFTSVFQQTCKLMLLATKIMNVT